MTVATMTLVLSFEVLAPIVLFVLFIAAIIAEIVKMLRKL